MRTTKGRIALVLLLLAMVFIVGLPALPWILNRPAIVEALIREFEQRTGHAWSAEAWHVRIFPSIGVELLHVQVQDRSSAAPLFVADRLEIALQSLPLLEGRIVGKDLVIDGPRLTVRRAMNGSWSLGGGRRASSSDDSEAPVAFVRLVQNLLLVDGLITVIDESGFTPHTPIQIVVTQGTLSSEVMGRHARLQVSGEIPQEPESAAFTFDGSLIRGADGTAVQAEGDFRLHRVNVRHAISAWAGQESVPDGLVGPAQLNAHMRLTLRDNEYELAADDWRVELSDISMQGTATVAGLGADHPHFSATLSAAPVMLTRLFSQLPSTWIPSRIRTLLVDHGVDGLLTLQTMSLSGEFGSGARPSVSGRIGLRNGRMILRPHYPSVEALSGSFAFDDAQVRITELRADYGPLRLTGEDLLITQWLSDPHIDVKIFGAGPLAGLVEAARRIEEDSLLRDVFARLQQATGDVELVAHVIGQPAEGERLSLVDVDFNFHHVGFRSAFFPLFVHDVQARIHGSPNLVKIEHLEGLVGPARLEAQGDMTWRGSQVYSDVKVNMTADATKVWSWIAENVEVGHRPGLEGAIRLLATVTGTVKEPRLAGRVEFQSAGLRIPTILTKPMHAPAAIEFDSHLSDGSLLTIRHVGLVLPPIKIVGDGTVRLSGDMAFAANVSSGSISLKELPVGIALGPIKAGTMSTKLHMEGQVQDRASWRTSGEIRFDRGAMTVEGLDEPIQDAFVTLRFDQDRIQIPRMAFHVGGSDLRISGSIVHWADSPKARLVIESSQIDVAAFRPSRQKSPRSGRDRSSGNSWWSDGTVEAFLFADHLYYKKFLLTDLSSRILWDHGLLTVERISGDTNEGHVAGQLKIRATGRRIEQARSTFRASGIPIDRVLSLVQEKPILTGWLTTSGKLQAEFERTGLTLGAVASPQPIQIVIEDGRIHNVPVISTLLSVMNLPALLQGQVDLVKDGLPLDRLKLVCSINNGVIHAKEFLLDSPILKISGTGRYDILADEFDMVLATSPLGSYSAMLKRIPLFGQLLAGDRQGFDTAVFELKGPANRPDLRYLPTESLMTGLKGTAQLAFDILVNAITLPKKAYSMVEEGITGKEDEDF